MSKGFEGLRDYNRFSYYDERGNVKKELLNTIAEQKAEFLARDRDKRGETNLSVNQLRKFYDQVKAIQKFLDQSKSEDAFNVKRPEIKMIRAQAAYAMSRNGTRITKDLKDFLDENVALISTLQDFQVFCKYFEAIVGFFNYYSKGRQN